MVLGASCRLVSSDEVVPVGSAVQWATGEVRSALTRGSVMIKLMSVAKARDDHRPRRLLCYRAEVFTAQKLDTFAQKRIFRFDLTCFFHRVSICGELPASSFLLYQIRRNEVQVGE